MYESFYGFKERPFSLLPDPDFLFLGEKHQAALDMLELAVFNHSGFAVISGEIGAGKTTLIRELLNRLHDNICVGLVSNTHPSFGSLMQWILAAYGLKCGSDDTIELHKRFVEFVINQYAQKKHTLLIIDEAQNLSVAAMEQLRLLSNVNSEKDLVLQVILVGQEQLRDKLRRPELQQFAQRVAVDYHLTGLGEQETCDYIRFRLIHAGAAPDLFSDDACREIYSHSGGIPRLINRVSDLSLVYAFSEQQALVTAEQVRAVIDDQRRGSLLETAGDLSRHGDGDDVEATAAEQPTEEEPETAIDVDTDVTVQPETPAQVAEVDEAVEVAPAEVSEAAETEPEIPEPIGEADETIEETPVLVSETAETEQEIPAPIVDVDEAEAEIPAQVFEAEELMQQTLVQDNPDPGSDDVAQPVAAETEADEQETASSAPEVISPRRRRAGRNTRWLMVAVVVLSAVNLWLSRDFWYGAPEPESQVAGEPDQAEMPEPPDSELESKSVAVVETPDAPTQQQAPEQEPVTESTDAVSDESLIADEDQTQVSEEAPVAAVDTQNETGEHKPVMAEVSDDSLEKDEITIATEEPGDTGVEESEQAVDSVQQEEELQREAERLARLQQEAERLERERRAAEQELAEERAAREELERQAELERERRAADKKLKQQQAALEAQEKQAKLEREAKEALEAKRAAAQAAWERMRNEVEWAETGEEE